MPIPVISMTSAIVNLTEENNLILNILKAKFGLRNKSDAMNRVVAEYSKTALEPALRPEYIRKISSLMKEKPARYRSFAEMRKAHQEA